jgi:hypothetical protein
MKTPCWVAVACLLMMPLVPLLLLLPLPLLLLLLLPLPLLLLLLLQFFIVVSFTLLLLCVQCFAAYHRRNASAAKNTLIE